jgi:hypothetical protein
MKKNKKASRQWLIPLTVSLILFLIGINVNEPQRVLEQAWNICLSCIGIG